MDKDVPEKMPVHSFMTRLLIKQTFHKILKKFINKNKRNYLNNIINSITQFNWSIVN
jgi:hypothetical protein